MKTLIPKRLLLFALLALCCGHASAQSVPALINYQGQLTDANGNALPTADYMLSFKIYDAATGGNLIWGPQMFDGATGTTGHRGKVPVVQGYFNLMLGETDTVSRSIADAFNGATRYVEVQVGSNNPVSPRQQILSAPFAMRASFAQEAANSQTLQGKPSGDFVAKSGDTMTGTLNLPADALNVGNGQLAVSGGNVVVSVADKFLVNRDGQILSFDGTELLFSNTPTYTYPSAHLKLVDGDYAGSRAIIHAQGNGGTIEALWVGSGGNVGIGTTSPSTTLEVAGTVKATAFQGQFAVNAISSSNIVDGAVTASKLASRPVGTNVPAGGVARSASTGIWTSPTPTVSTLVPALTVDITTTGRPVIAFLAPAPGLQGTIYTSGVNNGSEQIAYIELHRDGSLVGQQHGFLPNGGNTRGYFALGQFLYFDPPAAGQHRYQIRASVAYATRIEFDHVCLVVFEL